MCGQMDVRATEPAALPEISVVAPSSAMSSTGTRICRSHSFSLGGATIVAGRDGRTNAATVSSGRTVAERPIRWAGRSSSRSRRSRDSARWAPRLVPAIAWTSSRMTVSIPRSASRACEVSMRNSDSGVVIRMSGGRFASRARSAGRGVARADADADVDGIEVEAGRLALDADERTAQVALDVDRECLERRDVQDAAPAQAVVGDRVVHEPVDRVQEGREGLAAARRCHDQRVVALRDGRPCPELGRRRAGERPGEPGPGGGGERVEAGPAHEEPPRAVATADASTRRTKPTSSTRPSRAGLLEGSASSADRSANHAKGVTSRRPVGSPHQAARARAAGSVPRRPRARRGRSGDRPAHG